MTDEATPGALGSNDQLGMAPERATMRLTLEDLGGLAQTAERNGTSHAWQAVALEWCGKANAEVQRLRVQVRQADERGDEAMRRAHTNEALLQELLDCGAVTNWLRVSEDLKARIHAALEA